jgi:hypothetical protein
MPVTLPALVYGMTCWSASPRRRRQPLGEGYRCNEAATG